VLESVLESVLVSVLESVLVLPRPLRLCSIPIYCPTLCR
jgi:hypothetical protein